MNRKAILVQTTLKELQNLLDSGWTPSAAFQHPEGSLIILQKAIKPAK